MGDQRHQRHRREELPAVVGLLIGELGEKVLVDAAEDVAGDLLQLVRVERAQELAKDGAVQFPVFALGQDAAQAVVVVLNGLHGRDDSPGPVCAIRQGDEIVELRLGPKKDRAFLREIFFGKCPPLTTTGGKASLNARLDGQIAAIGVTQENQAHDRQEVFVAGVVGTGAERVRRAPEASFNGFNVFELRHIYPVAKGLTCPTR